MSEHSAPIDAGGPPEGNAPRLNGGGPPGPNAGTPAGLSAEAIETVLVRFRNWLSLYAKADSPTPASPETPPIDLSTLMGQMIGLKTEVNLQTRSVRAATEQNTEILRKYGELIVDRSESDGDDDGDEDRERKTDDLLRPMIRAVLETRDALALAEAEVSRLCEGLLDQLGGLITLDLPDLPELSEGLIPTAVATESRGWLGGVLQRRAGQPLPPGNPYGPDRQKLMVWVQKVRAGLEDKEAVQADALDKVQKGLDSLRTGYNMSLRRIERLFPQFDLEEIDCIGQAYDPEEMEAVETVSSSSLPSGSVAEVVRPGYTRKGRIFRFAQVRVVR